MLLKACLNGPRDVTEHPALPVRVASLAADALACVRAGAGAIHLHPRDADGLESLAAAVVDPVVPPRGGNPELVAAAAALIAGRSGLRR